MVIIVCKQSVNSNRSKLVLHLAKQRFSFLAWFSLSSDLLSSRFSYVPLCHISFFWFLDVGFRMGNPRVGFFHTVPVAGNTLT
jgi:hypothetical protein